jgi:hypothetical protein
MISPVVEQLSKEYADENVTFYKVWHTGRSGIGKHAWLRLDRSMVLVELATCPLPDAHLTHCCNLQVDIDTPAIQESVRDAGVASVPTFSFYRGGKKVATFSGADRRQLENNLVNLCSLGG